MPHHPDPRFPLLAARRRLGALASVLLALGCAGQTESPARSPSETSSVDATSGGDQERKAKPPDFQLTTLDGEVVQLSDHLGEDVVLLDFWATFCDPCLTAMPHLDELYQRYKDQGFVILGISIDGPDSVAQVSTEVSKLGVTFPILLDQESRVVSLYNPKTSAPYSVLIGRDGSILKRKEGYTTGDSEQLEQDLKSALAQ